MADPFDVSEFNKAASAMADPLGGDRGLNVRFYTDELQDGPASVAAGRPIFKTYEFCEIRIPGDKTNVRQGRVDKMHPDPRLRFAEAYARFQRGERIQVQGTLLREWTAIPRAEARTLEAAGIYTVEQLAALTDPNASRLIGSMALRQMARDFLATAEKMAPLTQARAENEKLRADLNALREMIEALGGKAPPAPVAPALTPAVPSVPLKADGTPRRKPGPKPKAPDATGHEVN